MKFDIYNQSQKLLRLITFHGKVQKKVFNLLKDTQNSSSPWFNVPVPKHAPPKSPNDQLPSQINKTHRQYLCLPKSLSYWLSGFYEELKEHYSLHRNSPISWQSVTKIIETDYIFTKKSKKSVEFAQRYPEFPSPWFNIVPSLEKLCQAVEEKNDQANLQPTLNKGAGGASLTIFVTDCRLIRRCRWWWWYSLFPFWTGNILFRQIWSKKSEFSV